MTPLAELQRCSMALTLATLASAAIRASFRSNRLARVIARHGEPPARVVRDGDGVHVAQD